MAKKYPQSLSVVPPTRISGNEPKPDVNVLTYSWKVGMDVVPQPGQRPGSAHTGIEPGAFGK